MIGEPFDHDPDIAKFGVYSYEEAVRMTEAGRVDGAAGSIVTLQRFARLHGTAERFGDPLVLAQISLALQMNRRFAETRVADQISRAVNELRESGRAKAIIDRFINDDSVRPY